MFKPGFQAAQYLTDPRGMWFILLIPTWLDPNTVIEQVAVLISHPEGRNELAGAKIVSSTS